MERTETFGRVILKKHVAMLNKRSSIPSYVSQQELQSVAVQCSFTQTLTRPITMMIFEPIILFTGIHISLAYGLIFFCFQAYPIIFEGTHFWFMAFTNMSGRQCRVSKENRLTQERHLWFQYPTNFVVLSTQ